MAVSICLTLSNYCHLVLIQRFLPSSLLPAAGDVGVMSAIEILRADLIRTMKLLGCASIQELSSRYVVAPAEWYAD